MFAVIVGGGWSISMTDSCPYDKLPCERFSDDLGCGVCEIGRISRKGVVSSDICSRFSVKLVGANVVQVFAVGGCRPG